MGLTFGNDRYCICRIRFIEFSMAVSLISSGGGDLTSSFFGIELCVLRDVTPRFLRSYDVDRLGWID